MRKFKLFINCDKEEKWLSEMLLKGYQLESVKGWDTNFMFYKTRKSSS